MPHLLSSKLVSACSCIAPLPLCRTSNLNLAVYTADAFDDLVKEAVRTANAAAQSRADYAASVIAAELAEARGDRVASKRGKRRSNSPKTSKRLVWAAEEHLTQHRVFSKVRVQSIFIPCHRHLHPTVFLGLWVVHPLRLTYAFCGYKDSEYRLRPQKLTLWLQGCTAYKDKTSCGCQAGLA